MDKLKAQLADIPIAIILLIIALIAVFIIGIFFGHYLLSVTGIVQYHNGIPTQVTGSTPVYNFSFISCPSSFSCQSGMLWSGPLITKNGIDNYSLIGYSTVSGASGVTTPYILNAQLACTGNSAPQSLVCQLDLFLVNKTSVNASNVKKANALDNLSITALTFDYKNYQNILVGGGCATACQASYPSYINNDQQLITIYQAAIVYNNGLLNIITTSTSSTSTVLTVFTTSITSVSTISTSLTSTSSTGLSTSIASTSTATSTAQTSISSTGTTTVPQQSYCITTCSTFGGGIINAIIAFFNIFGFNIKYVM